MPRDSGGVYTLPLADVIGNTVITATWANTTMNDIRVAMTDSLDRDGRGGMNVPLPFEDGTVGSPGMTWNNEPSTGFYRASAADMRVSVLGTDLFRWRTGVVEIWAAGAWRAVVYEGGTGGIAPGTLTNDSLRWDGATWTSTSNFAIDTSGNAVSLANIAAVTFTENGALLSNKYALQTYNLTAGDGLVGGGPISGNLTFDVAVGTGLVVNANDVALDQTYTDARYLLKNEQATDADTLDGQHGAFYQDASNMNTGFLPTGRLTGSYDIDITGDADTVDQKHIAVVASHPGGGADASTIYFVTGT